MSTKVQQSFQATELLDKAGRSHEEGDFENALNFALEALELIEVVLGKFHSDYLGCVSLIGLIYSDSGNQEKSFEYMEKLEEILEDPQIKDTALGILFKLDLIAFYRRGLFNERAGDLILEAQISINNSFENCSDEERPDLLCAAKDAYRLKGQIDSEAGRFDEAVGAFDCVLGYCEELQETSDTTYAEILIEKARSNCGLLQFDLAQSGYEQALALYERNLGILSESVGFLSEEIAHFFLNLGNFELTKTMTTKASLAFKRSRGPKSIEYAQVMLLHAEVLVLEELYDEASEIGIKALEIARVATKEDRQELLHYLSTVSTILNLKGDDQQAQVLEKELNDLTVALDSQ